MGASRHRLTAGRHLSAGQLVRLTQDFYIAPNPCDSGQCNPPVCEDTDPDCCEADGSAGDDGGNPVDPPGARRFFRPSEVFAQTNGGSTLSHFAVGAINLFVPSHSQIFSENRDNLNDAASDDHAATYNITNNLGFARFRKGVQIHDKMTELSYKDLKVVDGLTPAMSLGESTGRISSLTTRKNSGGIDYSADRQRIPEPKSSVLVGDLDPRVVASDKTKFKSGLDDENLNPAELVGEPGSWIDLIDHPIISEPPIDNDNDGFFRDIDAQVDCTRECGPGGCCGTERCCEGIQLCQNGGSGVYQECCCQAGCGNGAGCGDPGGDCCPGEGKICNPGFCCVDDCSSIAACVPFVECPEPFCPGTYCPSSDSPTTGCVLPDDVCGCGGDTDLGCGCGNPAPKPCTGNGNCGGTFCQQEGDGGCPQPDDCNVCGGGGCVSCDEGNNTGDCGCSECPNGETSVCTGCDSPDCEDLGCGCGVEIGPCNEDLNECCQNSDPGADPIGNNGCIECDDCPDLLTARLNGSTVTSMKGNFASRDLAPHIYMKHDLNLGGGIGSVVDQRDTVVSSHIVLTVASVYGRLPFVGAKPYARPLKIDVYELNVDVDPANANCSQYANGQNWTSASGRNSTDRSATPISSVTVDDTVIKGDKIYLDITEVARKAAKGDGLIKIMIEAGEYYTSPTDSTRPDHANGKVSMLLEFFKGGENQPKIVSSVLRNTGGGSGTPTAAGTQSVSGRKVAPGVLRRRELLGIF